MWYFLFGMLCGYVFGYYDGRWAKPPPPMKGTYDSGSHDDRVEDYPDDWS